MKNIGRSLTKRQMWLYGLLLNLVIMLFGTVLGMAQNVLAADGNYLTFSGDSAFSLYTKRGEKFWDGTLEYSTDAVNWQTWNGTVSISSSSSSPCVLYLRGNNRYVGDKTQITGPLRNSLILSDPTE